METTNPQNLKYGIIYLFSDKRLSPRLHDLEAVVKNFVHPLQVEWVDEPGRDDLLLIARRFNVGNIGKYATVSLSLSPMNQSDVWLEAINRFADKLMGVTDAGDGDIVIDEGDAVHNIKRPQIFSASCKAAPQDHTRVKKASPKRTFRKLKDKLHDFVTEDMCLKESMQDSMQDVPCEIEYDSIEKEEKRAVKKLEREREIALERIKRDIVNYIARYHDDPKELMAELLRGKVVVGQPGRVLVNGDLKIVLPEYDEMEIEMPAMCRTLYILFMKQRKQGLDGIVLKNMDEHRDEILDIYGMVKPGANERRVCRTVDNLCDPLGDSLNQTISRINRCIKTVITDKELAKLYIIQGTKGGTYGISLEPQYLELPRAVTRQ